MVVDFFILSVRIKPSVRSSYGIDESTTLALVLLLFEWFCD